MQWVLPKLEERPECRHLAEQLGVPVSIARLLYQRGYQTLEEAAQFLDPKLAALTDPFLLPDMEKAVDRLLQAVEKKQRVVLYGDYDVDGLTSLSLLSRILRAYGCNVVCFIPDRMNEGYGLSAKGVERCVQQYAPELLVAIDCGTSSVAEIHGLNKTGVDVVVLDHHECPPELPSCVALVNPKRGTTGGYLCSVGIVFKVAHAMLKKRPNASIALKEYLDLVALGSVADLVPLVEENRILVFKGLRQMARTQWHGLRILAEMAGVQPPVATADIGFKISPRLNAAGRLGNATRALELLLSADDSEATELARELEGENQSRKEIGEQVYQLAEREIARHFNPNRDSVIIIGGSGWHEGVIGIAASKLMHKYNRPTVVVGFNEQGLGKGSCRSIPGFSLVQALRACEEDLEKCGGHDMAAGLSVRAEKFDRFRDNFQTYAAEMLKKQNLTPQTVPDMELNVGEVTMELLEAQERLGPFGVGNPHPAYLLRGVKPHTRPRILKEKHVSFELASNGVTSRAIWFNAFEKGGEPPQLPPPPWDIVFELTRNEYQGKVHPQIQVRHLRRASGEWHPARHIELLCR